MKLAHIFLVSSTLFVYNEALADNEVWNQKANFGGPARHRCTAFAIGNKGYIGLGHINSTIDVEYADFWEYDPSTNSWSQKADFGGGQRYHAFGFTIGSKAYVGTGRKPSGGYEDDLWEFDPIANTWTQKTDIPGANRRGAIAFVLDGIGYVGTGEVTGTGFSNDFFAYNSILDSWYQIATFPGAERTAAVCFTIGDRAFVGTGGLGVGMNDFWEYIPSLDQWIQRADVGPTPRQEAVGFSVNGKGYIGTGDDFSSGTNFGDMWEYDANTDTWTQTADFGGIPRRYLVSFVIGSKVYAGTGTNGTNFKDFWEYDKLLSLEKSSEKIVVSVYPNPTSEFITIDLGAFDTKETSIQFYQLDGKLIYTAKITNQKTTIDIKSLGSGTYFYSILSNQDIVKSGKIILNL